MCKCHQIVQEGSKQKLWINPSCSLLSQFLFASYIEMEQISRLGNAHRRVSIQFEILVDNDITFNFLQVFHLFYLNFFDNCTDKMICEWQALDNGQL